MFLFYETVPLSFKGKYILIFILNENATGVLDEKFPPFGIRKDIITLDTKHLV